MEVNKESNTTSRYCFKLFGKEIWEHVCSIKTFGKELRAQVVTEIESRQSSTVVPANYSGQGISTVLSLKPCDSTQQTSLRIKGVETASAQSSLIKPYEFPSKSSDRNHNNDDDDDTGKEIGTVSPATNCDVNDQTSLNNEGATSDKFPSIGHDFSGSSDGNNDCDDIKETSLCLIISKARTGTSSYCSDMSGPSCSSLAVNDHGRINLTNPPEKSSSHKRKSMCSSKLSGNTVKKQNSSGNEEKIERKKRPSKSYTQMLETMTNTDKLPEDFATKIEKLQVIKEKPVLILHKYVFKSDVEADQQRLLIPKLQIKTKGFLNESEKKTIEDEGHLSVTVLYRKPTAEGREGLTMVDQKLMTLSNWPLPKKPGGEEKKNKPSTEDGKGIRMIDQEETTLSKSLSPKEGGSEQKKSKPLAKDEEVITTNDTASALHKEGGSEKKKSGSYALIKGWKDVKDDSKIKEGDVVQVWSFRPGKERKLGLAVVKIDDEICERAKRQIELGQSYKDRPPHLIGSGSYEVGESSGTAGKHDDKESQ